jgi:2-polyprenyl-3-methyl-5-hydroxy-6-metoxy-1,4-benzoquinol methylase
MSRKQPVMEKGTIAGNLSNKYSSRNPITRRLMSRFESTLLSLVCATNTQTVHEVGCGEGYLSVLLAKNGYIIQASDFSAEILEIARTNAKNSDVEIDFRVMDIYKLPPDYGTAELVVCCEVLEHLHRPDIAMNNLCRLAQSHVILSVPLEPIWRVLNMVRGKYWTSLGNTPGHLQHWSKKNFLRFLEPFIEVKMVSEPFPWIMVMGLPRYQR